MTQRGRTLPRLDVHVQYDVPAAMRDGTVLRANVYRPAGNGRYPVLLSRQPYNKDVNINLMYVDPERLAAAGYIVVMQDVRGRYASDGCFDPGRQEFDDGHDTVEWAAALPGSTGVVGTWGRSYHAETQWRAAVTQPPSLRSMVSGVSKFHYSIEAQERPGGAHEGSRLGWRQFLIGPNELERRYRDDPAGAATAMTDFAATTARLASGELLDTLPLRDVADLPGSMMGEVVRAMADSPRTPLPAPWPPGMYDLVTADTFHIGGWYDIFTMGTLAQYQAMASVAHRAGRRAPRLLIGPWSHSSFLGSSGHLDFGPLAGAANIDGRGGMNDEHLRWFDATLKGDESALADVAPVRLFVIGENRWRNYQEYPVPDATVEDWYLHPAGGLSRDPSPAAEPDCYTYDPACPAPTVGGSTMLTATLPPGPFDQRAVEARPDVLSYTSEPLTRPYTVLGTVWMTLFASSSAPDTDFVARLVDVYPDGRAINVVDGIIRAATRESYRQPGHVEPVQASLLERDECYEFTIDLSATGITFLPGHRLRIDITSSSHPHWIRHTNTAADQVDATALTAARQRIFHDPRRPSRVHLTVVGSVR